jgi:cold-inducible RNA-binding protein
MRKLFVGNLPWKIREPELEKLLEDNELDCERVEVVLERDTDRSRGFGFLHFATDSDGLAALEVLDGLEVEGRVINVSEAIERRGEEHRGGGRPEGGGSRRRDDRPDRRGPREW